MTAQPTTVDRTDRPTDDHDPVPVDGASVVIEATTAEEALAELHAQLGPTAQVVEVRKLHRGGIGGFFTREIVQLHARPAAASTPTAPAGADAGPRRDGHGTSGSASDQRPVDRLLDADADGVIDFATYLRDHLGPASASSGHPGVAGARPGLAPTAGGGRSRPADPDLAPQVDVAARQALLERVTAAARAANAEPTGGGVVDPTVDTAAAQPEPAAVAPVEPGPAAAAQPEPAAVAPVEAGPAAAAEVTEPTPAAPQRAEDTDGLVAEPPASTEVGPAWSVASLVKLGLPASLVRDLHVAAPHDDVAWTAALAGALRPLCRPLPSGRSLVIGPRARSLANATRTTVTSVHQPIRSRAAVVAATVGAGAAGRGWVERARGNRWLHLVVGGSGWRTLLHLDPLAVSWASLADLPEAVRLAAELGLVLGSGPLGGTVQRARPLDLALAIRAQLPVSR